MTKTFTKNFRPSCIHDNKEPAYSATGYILPCCWCDTGFVLEDGDFTSIVQEKFKLERVNDVKEIVESDEWKEFFEFKTIPLVCQRYCGGNRKAKEVIYE